MGMPRSVTVSSSTAPSTAINLDWMAAKRTSWGVTGSSSGTFTYTVEGALDDLQSTPAASVAWFALSSATTTNSSINTYAGPLAGIRLNPSAVSSAVLVLRVLQGIGW